MNAGKAPSACNRQPWRFYAVDNENIIKKIISALQDDLPLRKEEIRKRSEIAQRALYDFYQNLWNAPCVIFVYREITGNDITKFYDLLSVGCAIQNLSLSATNEGLGTCLSGGFKGKVVDEKLRKILNVPNDYELMIGVILGYPAEDFKPIKIKQKELKEILNIFNH
jgi:nitroreductase